MSGCIASPGSSFSGEFKFTRNHVTRGCYVPPKRLPRCFGCFRRRQRNQQQGRGFPQMHGWRHPVERRWLLCAPHWDSRAAKRQGRIPKHGRGFENPGQDPQGFRKHGRTFESTPVASEVSGMPSMHFPTFPVFLAPGPRWREVGQLSGPICRKCISARIFPEGAPRSGAWVGCRPRGAAGAGPGRPKRTAPHPNCVELPQILVQQSFSPGKV